MTLELLEAGRFDIRRVFDQAPEIDDDSSRAVDHG
jgi:hypothetical protein